MLKGTNPRSIQRYTITDCVQLALENKCALSYQIIEHPSLAGIKYRPTRACVISNTRNRNIILKELEQQKALEWMFPFPLPFEAPLLPQPASPGNSCSRRRAALPGREGRVVRGFPVRRPCRHRRAGDSALPNPPPSLPLGVDCKRNTTVALRWGKRDFFLRHSVRCVNGLIINQGLPRNPLQNPKSCHITELSVLILSAYKRKQGHQFSLGGMTPRL